MLKKMQEKTMPSSIRIATMIPDAPMSAARSRMNQEPTS